MKHAVVLMTALLPTRGHAALGAFAARFPSTHVHVLINARSFEPVSGELRVAAVSEALSAFPQVTVRLSTNDEAPQNPPDHPHFWEWWRDEINRHFPEAGGKWDYVVASELYGAEVAEALGAEFMPYDIGRELNPVRGTAARKDPWQSWPELLPAARRHYQVKAVLFGQESTGKTTLSKLVAERLQVQWLFEYARPYQLAMGAEVTLPVMAAIHRGQQAVQEAAFAEASTPALLLDTDLFSTVGYYPLMNEEAPQQLLTDARRLASSLYFLAHDEVPFEADVLRYGGDRRESSRRYWQDLLEREKLPYLLLPMGTIEEQALFIETAIRQEFQRRVASLAEFERE